MKIEKISDEQIKFILSKSDLLNRDLEFSELEYGSEKTRRLFREMMTEAHNRYGFRVENVPLMIEAIPITTESLMIIVTKISNLKGLDSKLNLFKQEREIPRPRLKQPEFPHKTPIKPGGAVYIFSALDQISSVAQRITKSYKGASSVYKYKNRYYLILEGQLNLKLIAYLNEYGQKHSSQTKFKHYLAEHGELISKEFALEKFSMI